MSSPSTTQSNSLSGETQSSHLPSGNMSDQSQEPDTFKVTSSLAKQSGSSELQALLAKARTLSAEEARNWKPSVTAQKKKHGSKARGHTERQRRDKDIEAISITSDDESSKEQPFGKSHKKRLPRMPDIIGDYELSKKSRRSLGGEKYEISTYSARQGLGSRRSFTSSSGTTTYTLWQAKSMAGTMGMKDSVFSSLTSMRGLLNRKRSMSCWMDIHSDFRSKAGSQALAIMLELLSATNPGVPAGRTPPSEDSAQEDSSDSMDRTDMVSQTPCDLYSESISSDEDTDQQPWSSGHGSQFFDDEAEEEY